MSQSDFHLPHFPPRDYSVPKKYDFVFSGSDQDVYNDCVGWSMYAKNWTFAYQSLEVLCDMGLTGVIVATIGKKNNRACRLPPNCGGGYYKQKGNGRSHIIQTLYLEKQNDFYDYVRDSRFLWLPQVHDASPRVSTQALALDVPILVNKHISGGWKYVTDKTGEFFSSVDDIRPAAEKILKGSEERGRYEPQKEVLRKYGNENSGRRLYKWVKDNFSDRVALPEGTTRLVLG